ncbi:MAG: single-stranded-DNA-specific exonuclease RecJ [Verrucomicrobia bacterium]|nr:single-stranded-DNA-specific exonuclease RecJ [Verrucomicrobiota bacterium]
MPQGNHGSGADAPEHKIWCDCSADEQKASALAAEMKLPFPVARVLVSRGLTNRESVDHFLNPRLSDLGDPFELPDMKKAVTRILHAVQEGEPMVVHGDYDVDGVTSTALLVQVIAALGGKVTGFLPHRVADGYGFSENTLRQCVEQSSPRLIITVDCGTGSIDAVRAASEMGIDIVITDHHEAAEGVAPAFAVVNPKLGVDAGLRTLAGVGVAFKLAHALVKVLRKEGRPDADLDLRRFLDLVAVGTVADIVPLVGENRILSRHGLAQLERTESVGFQALKQVVRLEGEIEAYHVGFILGPRINAAGRVATPLLALEMLLSGDGDHAREVAAKLDQANKDRQEIEVSIVEEALQQIESIFDPSKHYGIVVSSRGWHPGIIGIVASRLVGRFYRPTAVIAIDEEGKGRGSCRSIEGFNLVDALGRCSELLHQFGGHAMAAGLDIDEANIPRFTELFNSVAAEELDQATLRPHQNIDAWIDLADADPALVQSVKQLGPFGEGNREPVWASENIRIVRQSRIVGKKHLKLTLGQGGAQKEAIGFGMGARAVPEGPIDVAFRVQMDTYRGGNQVQLVLRDFRPHGSR